MDNYSDCWELSSFSLGERLSPKLAVANRKIVGNSKPKSWYGSTFGLSRRGRLYLLKNPAVTHAGGIFLSSALPAEPECWSWCPIWFSGKVVPEQLFLKIRSDISFSIPALPAMLKRGKFRQHGLLPDFSKDRASLFARGQKLIRINFSASSCPQFSGSLQPVSETSAHRVKMRTTLSSQSSYPQFWQAELWITTEDVRLTTAKAGSHLDIKCIHLISRCDPALAVVSRTSSVVIHNSACQNCG